MSAQPFLKFAGPLLDEATIAGVADVLRSGHIASGPWVQQFESALSTFCGGRQVRVLTSATAAIEVALQLCGIGPGDGPRAHRGRGRGTFDRLLRDGPRTDRPVLRRPTGDFGPSRGSGRT